MQIVKITEIREKEICIFDEDFDFNAEEQVRNKYNNGEIELTEDDIIMTEFKSKEE